MAINLQDSTASYGFQKQQQQAVHIRITREMKEALERARTSGAATSLQMPGAGAGLVSKLYFLLNVMCEAIIICLWYNTKNGSMTAAGDQDWQSKL